VQFEMQLRPGVHAFLKEMSSLFCVYLYTMGSREYVQQALRHLDPTHEIFRPGQARVGCGLHTALAATCSHT